MSDTDGAAGGQSKAAMAGDALVKQVLSTGIQGAGPFKSAVATAEEALRHANGDRDQAVDRIVRTHVTLAGAEGFATGLPGGVGILAAIPADLTAFYLLAGRMVGGIAHVRGYDTNDDAVRTTILLAMLGSAGAQVLKEVGIAAGQHAALAAVKKVPGKVLIEINKKVGKRLITKFGEKGVINLGKLIPLVGGPIGATTNVASMWGIAKAAKTMLPAVAMPGDPAAVVVVDQ